MDVTTGRGYEAIKRLAKEVGCNIPDLLALARQNDPYMAGSPAQRIKAEWFADLWQRFGYDRGVHLRRMHYQLLSHAEIRKDDGEPYENTEGCWNYLCEAGKAARYLGLVDPDAFEDRRNPEPYLLASVGNGELEPGQWVDEPSWYLPSISANLEAGLDLRMPSAGVSGYDYRAADQPFLVELWIEKSTQNDVLMPICREFGLNLVTSLGFQSITSVVNLLHRVAEADKPARLFYISDFDPAGDKMPPAVARQIEYWLPEYAPGADVKLTPVALTREQVRSYRLPRIPVKDSDRRKANFEERYGEGAVELDALEALHPGALAEIVRQAVTPYRDEMLEERLREAEEEAQEATTEAWEDAIGPYKNDLAEVEVDAAKILRRYQGQLERLREQMAAEIEPLQGRLNSVRLAVQEAADSLEVELPERPEAEPEPADESEWLFDAGRDYLEQIAVYKARTAPAA